MAHKGKVYKLWWRRDAAWELNNYNFGWPEAYRILSHGLIFSARYAVEVIDYNFALNFKKTYDRTWESEPRGGFFDNAYWRIEFPGPPDEPLELIKFGLWHNAIIDTPLFTATYQFSELDPDYHFMRVGALRQLHFLSPDVQVNPDRFLPIIVAARWDVYHP